MARGGTRRAAALVAAIGVLAGCGEVAAPERPQPLRFEAGVATLDVPLSDRELPTPVVTDRYVVVYGGRERSGPTPKGDGAVYDLERQVWSPMAPAPVDAPLLYSSGVWTGTEVVFVGTPCPDPRNEDDGEFVECGADPVAVAYSPEHDAWRTLPRLRLAQPTHGISLLSRAIGFASGQAVFTYDPGTATNDLLLVDAETGVSETVEAPTPSTCAVGGRVLAFGPDSNGNFGSPVEPPADALRVREWTEAHGWQDLGPPPRPTPGQVFSADVTCGPGAAAYLPVQSPPAGLGRDLRWYDDAAGTWPAVPALTPQGYPGVVRVASLRGVRVLVTDAHVFTLDPGAPAWAVHPSIPGHRLLANGRYLVTTDNDDGVRLRVVDVASLSPT